MTSRHRTGRWMVGAVVTAGAAAAAASTLHPGIITRHTATPPVSMGTVASPVTGSSATPALAGSQFTPDNGHTPTCTTRSPATGFTPTRIWLTTYRETAPVTTVGVAADGTIGVPNPNLGHTVGWFNQSTRPGVTRPQVILTAHTWHVGGAIGNELINHPPTVGDRIILADNQQHVACYRYTNTRKVPATSNPTSSGLVGASADGVSIVVCDDYDPATGVWNTRDIIHAT